MGTAQGKEYRIPLGLHYINYQGCHEPVAIEVRASILWPIFFPRRKLVGHGVTTDAGDEN